MDKFVYIRVFVTNTRKLRVSIQEEGKRAYSVTVGSVAWEKGKGREYENKIKEKSFKFVNRIRNEYEKYFNN